MSSNPDLQRPLVPTVYAAQLSQLVARWGVNSADLLAGTGLSAEQLADTEGRLKPAAMAALVHQAYRLTGEPGLGFYFGLQLKLSSHGWLGLAAMTSTSLREALVIAVRFVRLRSAELNIHLHQHGDQAVIEIEERLPLGELRSFVFESLFTCLAHIGALLLGHPVQGRAEFMMAEPAYFRGYAHFLPGAVAFGCARNGLVFPASYLDEPLAMADPIARSRALAECERELAQIGEVSQLLVSVRRQLASWPEGFPSLIQLADLRHTSARTLKRQLSAHGSSYRDLLEDVRESRALTLLADPAQSVERIAEVLGYRDGSNFNRAFKRWRGVAPSAWRKQQAT